MKTILCIDDEPTQLMLLRLALTRAGFQVLEADDGQTGIEMTAEHQPALVIMDLMMPGCWSHVEIKNLIKLIRHRII